MFTEQERLNYVAKLTAMNADIEAGEKEIAKLERMLNDIKESHNKQVRLRDMYAEILKSVEDEA